MEIFKKSRKIECESFSDRGNQHRQHWEHSLQVFGAWGVRGALADVCATPRGVTIGLIHLKVVEADSVERRGVGYRKILRPKILGPKILGPKILKMDFCQNQYRTCSASDGRTSRGRANVPEVTAHAPWSGYLQGMSPVLSVPNPTAREALTLDFSRFFGNRHN